MKRKLLAMLLSLAMLFTLLPPGAAVAADGDQIIVGGKLLSGSSTQPAYATTNDEGELTQGGNENNYNIKWDGETLTLNSATIKGAAGSFMRVYQGACVQASHGYKVELIGKNKLMLKIKALPTPMASMQRRLMVLQTSPFPETVL